MDRPVLHVAGLVFIRAVVHPPRQVVNLLMKTTAEGDVELLKAAADAENGNPGVDRVPDQGQRGGVALGVVERAVGARRPVVVGGLDVGGASGKEQAVAAVQHRVLVQRPAERGHRHG